MDSSRGLSSPRPTGIRSVEWPRLVSGAFDASLRPRKRRRPRRGLLMSVVPARLPSSWSHFSRASLRPAASLPTGSVEDAMMRSRRGSRRPRCPISCPPRGWTLGASAAAVWSKCPLVGLEVHRLPAPAARRATRASLQRQAAPEGRSRRAVDPSRRAARPDPEEARRSGDLVLDEPGSPPTALATTGRPWAIASAM